MADSDYNMIKPVESLQNVGGLTPVKRENEKKRRQKQQKQNEQEQEQEPNESAEEIAGNDGIETQPDQHSIDYCA